MSALQPTFSELSLDTFHQMRRAAHNNAFADLNRQATPAEWEALASDLRTTQGTAAPPTTSAPSQGAYGGTGGSYPGTYGQAATGGSGLTGTYDFQSSVKRVANMARQNAPWPQEVKNNMPNKKGFLANFISSPVVQDVALFVAFIAAKTFMYWVFRKGQQKGLSFPD